MQDDLKTIKSLLSKYEHLLESITTNKRIKLYEVLTFEEKIKSAELELDILRAHSKKEARLAQQELHLLLEGARLRYQKSKGIKND